jgi:pSer/pThr/pTyr-binding forkhead associated (FHA) protein
MARIVLTHDGQTLREADLPRGRHTIGRRPDNQLVLEDRTVSAAHAALIVDAEGVELQDLGSTNGTYVNGKRVTTQRISAADHVRLARVTLELLAEPPPPTPIANIKIINGPNAGKVLELAKPVATLGRPRIVVVVIARQSDGYTAAQIEGDQIATVNGQPVGKGIPLKDGDELDVAGTRIKFYYP